MAVAFRRHMLLPLDDCFYALQATIPRLSRSALHRCFLRHGISRLPLSEEGQRPPKKEFRDYPIGYLHVDFTGVKTEESKQYPFVAIDRPSNVAFAVLHPRAQRVVAAEFLRRVLAQLPYKVHTVLTDNGVPFTPQAHQFLPDGHSPARRTQPCPADTALAASAASTAWSTARPSRPTPGPTARSSA